MIEILSLVICILVGIICWGLGSCFTASLVYASTGFLFAYTVISILRWITKK